MRQKILNIGILAHVDAGKTTLAENILFRTGAIRSKGSVDAGSTVTDSLTIERKRGISIRTAAICVDWGGTRINLIDTPGHADFSAEVERCLAVMDAAILMVSAVEGVQSHTYGLWDAMQSMKIPVLVVVNKIDRQGADYQNVLDELKNELQIKTFPINVSVAEGSKTASIENIWEKGMGFYDFRNMGLENLSEIDETVLEKYLDGHSFTWEELKPLIRTYCGKCELVPVVASIAKEDKGTLGVLDAITRFFPLKDYETDCSPGALVFKTEQDKTLGRVAHIKMFAGTLKSRDPIMNITQNTENKIAQVRKAFVRKLEKIDVLTAGDVGAVSGLPDVMAGDVLGSGIPVPELTPIRDAVLAVRVKPEKDEHYAKLSEALAILNSEDPALGFVWYKQQKELHLKLMGPMQMEVLEGVIAERFSVGCVFEKPTVIYKETPVNKVEGFAKYTMPKPCWAVLKLRIVPGELNSGVVYSSKVSFDKIARKYQNEICETVYKSMRQGIKGWQVTDIEIILVDGEDHEIHSRPGDFIIATPMALMDGLKKAGTNLLEPLYSFEIKASEGLLGSIAGDLTQMRAVFASPVFINGNFVLKGIVPVATALDYSIKLSSITGGKGKMRLKSGGYQKCDDSLGLVRKYIGVSPLNHSQWILHNRGAFKADQRV